MCTFAWLYGDGSSAAGVLLSAPVELGGRQANSTFGGIIRASDNFFEAPRGGGIMGLSFGGYSLCDSEFSCFPPLLDDIVRQCHLDDKFTVCAHGDDAVLILGGGDSRLYEGNVTYAPLQPPFGFYWVDVKDVQMAGETLVERSSPSFLSRLRQVTEEGGREREGGRKGGGVRRVLYYTYFQSCGLWKICNQLALNAHRLVFCLPLPPISYAPVVSLSFPYSGDDGPPELCVDDGPR